MFKPCGINFCVHSCSCINIPEPGIFSKFFPNQNNFSSSEETLTTNNLKLSLIKLPLDCNIIADLLSDVLLQLFLSLLLLLQEQEALLVRVLRD